MPTSRWMTTDFFGLCTNSIGSSTVMMWLLEFSLRWSIIEASVVDLPLPVAPMTITKPRLTMEIFFRMSGTGSSRSSSFGIIAGIRRSTRPGTFFCR